MKLKTAANRLLPNSILRRLKGIYYRIEIKNSELTDYEELPLIASLVKPGDVCLDVGANIGIYTKHLSEMVGEKGRVVAFEPVAETFQYLEGSVRALRMGNVQLVHGAVSNSLGEVNIEVPLWPDGTRNFYEAHVTPGNEVKCFTLDSFCASYSRLDFAKIDVEGHEFEVLTGARKILTRLKPALLVETSKVAVFELLGELGYSAHVAEAGELIQYSGQFRVNYFFLPHVGSSC